ncbi:MAG: amino acid adenylation domain-containing protein [Planctomycetota bacterium]
MSVGQQGLWHAYRRDPQATPFNVFLPTRVRSGLNVDALRSAMQWIVDRNTALRTVFSDQGGSLNQIVRKSLPAQFTVVPMLGASDEELQQAALSEAAKPFDLEEGPLLRMVLLQAGETDFVILALTHHIIVDFWSLVLILDEVRHSYAAFSTGGKPQLPAPASNYPEFISGQARYLDSKAGEADAHYWQQRMDGVVPVLDLPCDYLRPANFTGRAANQALSFASGLGEELAEFAARNRATVFSVVQSAVQTFVHLLTREECFAIGSPFAGRHGRQYERTVGFFVNMLPIRADLSGKPTFEQVVRQTSLEMLGAIEHEAYPIARIVEDAKVARDPSRSPLFQVSCTFEKSQLKEESGRAAFLFPGEPQVWNFAGLKQESFYVPVETCHYDLEFIFEQDAAELRGMICYNRDLFTPATMSVWSEMFSRLLPCLLQHASTAIPDLPWLELFADRSSEDNSIGGAVAVGETGTGNTAEASGLTVPSMLREGSRLANEEGETEAIVFQGQRISFTEFETWSQSISQTLADCPQETGVAPVPILAERGPAAWAAMWGVHKAARAFVPIDAAQPGVDLQQLAGSSPTLKVLSDGATLSRDRLQIASQHQGVELKVQSVSDLRRTSVDRSEHAAQAITSDPGQPAYVVFTSGSTGEPKGVVVSHDAVCNTLEWRNRCVPLSSADRVLMLLSHQFDAGLGIAWTTLTQGATLVMADEDDVRDPSRIVDLMIRERVSVLPAPPSLLDVILAHPRFRECASRLRYVWTGGEAMPSTLPQRVRDLTAARFLNFYGPTEAAIECSYGDVTDHPVDRPVTIGKPVDHMEMMILDEAANPLPPTVPGEIAIAGRGLADSYLADPSLTKQRFVLHPTDPTQRVYLTGDRGRINAEGEIEFLGRTDHQVKVRGYRLELGEVEKCIEDHPATRRCAVVVDGLGSPEARLVAFVSPDRQRAPKDRTSFVADLTRFVGSKLPPYKRPARFCVLDELPMTSSGKVDRKRLPSSDEVAAAEPEPVPAASAIERYLLDRWSLCLSRENLGTNQNFFEAGGTSLQAAMLTSELSVDLGVDIPTSLIFDLVDIHQFANRLVQLHESAMEARFGADEVQLQVRLKQESQLIRGHAETHELIAELGGNADSQPIFMVHPPGGIVVCYRELASQIEDYCIHGIRSRGLHGAEELPPTMEAMAEEYEEALRTVQPSGPYVLGGWSLGGLVAYEVAQRLLASGETVDRLILIDTTIPASASELVPEAETVDVGREYGIELTLEQLGDLQPEEQLPFLWEHAKKLGVLEEDSPPEVVAKALEDLQQLFHHHVEVARHYRMHPISCPVQLLRPLETPVEVVANEDRGWRYLAKELVVDWVPGHHHSMVQPPHVVQLAAAISKHGRGT